MQGTLELLLTVKTMSLGALSVSLSLSQVAQVFLIAADLLLHCNMLVTTWVVSVAAPQLSGDNTTRPAAAASIPMYSFGSE